MSRGCGWLSPEPPHDPTETAACSQAGQDLGGESLNLGTHQAMSNSGFCHTLSPPEVVLALALLPLPSAWEGPTGAPLPPNGGPP